MASAKQSKIEKLHAAFTNTLADILNAHGADTPAAQLSVIRSFLSDSGVKPVSDSPAHQRLMSSFADLPFKSEDDAPPSPSHSAGAQEVQH
jgi:hypothetical protein